ncbi:MAG: hypothetical protein HYT72_05575 [Candidatus Aenigmarchaeota archaeon]|nr:hypothetical protein [Candidatus Aenigmarchaeota archaeon]
MSILTRIKTEKSFYTASDSAAGPFKIITTEKILGVHGVNGKIPREAGAVLVEVKGSRREE